MRDSQESYAAKQKFGERKGHFHERARNSRVENLRAGNWREPEIRGARKLAKASPECEKEVRRTWQIRAGWKLLPVGIILRSWDGHPGPGADVATARKRGGCVPFTLRSRRGGNRVGFSKPARGVTTSGRRASARCAGAFVAFPLSSSFSISHFLSVFCEKIVRSLFITGVD